MGLERAAGPEARSSDPAATTEDRLLGGRVTLTQPAAGYRAATDPVFLAAATPAAAGERVLDLGCGAGAAALCLAARVAGLELHGLERDPLYARLAALNAAANRAPLSVHAGDLRAPPAALRALVFDHAMLNPPFQPQAAPASPDARRDAANRETGAGLEDWIGAALRRLRPGGRLTLIHRAERVPAILAALAGRAGDILLKPLQPRAGRPAGRVIVAARKGARGPFRLLPPLLIHAGDAHLADRDDFTDQAAAILRNAAPLDLTLL